MHLKEILDEFPRIQLVNEKQQDDVFKILEQSSMSSNSLSISFERKPNFFSFLKAQGHKSFVFTFHNKSGEAHGLACITLRKYQHEKRMICLGYASDLRTTQKLDRDARLQWRKMYSRLVSDCSLIEDFEGCERLLTAVWDENAQADRALKKKGRKFDFEYSRSLSYSAYSLWGRWSPSCLLKTNGVRRILNSEISIVEDSILSQHELNWTRDDLISCLRLFEKGFEDFLVYVVSGQIQAFALPLSQDSVRSLVVKSLPKSLKFATSVLPAFGLKRIEIGKPLKTQHLTFFRSLQGDGKMILPFLDFLWKENSSRRSSEKFQILNFSHWGDSPLPVFQRGYLSQKISGGLFEVRTFREKERIQNYDYQSLEIGFL